MEQHKENKDWQHITSIFCCRMKMAVLEVIIEEVEGSRSSCKLSSVKL